MQPNDDSAGQSRCHICNVWLNYHGIHLKDGSPATADTIGGFCNCCSYRVRQDPGNMEYESKPKQSHAEEESRIDLSYFTNHRARLLKVLGSAIAKEGAESNKKNFKYFFPKSTHYVDIVGEFGVSIEEMYRLAKTLDPPNKASMIAEFERVKLKVGRVPTKEDIEEHSTLTISRYENEFQSWEHLVNRLGYDSFYRDQKRDSTYSVKQPPMKSQTESSIQEDVDKLNVLIEKAVRMIKSAKDGSYMSDIMRSLKLSQEDMSYLATKILRVEGISKKEIKYHENLEDILLQYDPAMGHDTEESDTSNERGNSYYSRIFDEYLKGIRASSSYQYVILYALADVGRYGDDGLVGKRWITQDDNKVTVNLNFLAIRFIKYYLETVNSKLRHTPKGMAVANKVGGDINILDHIREQRLSCKEDLKTLADYSMADFRKKIITKSMKPEVLRVIINNMRHPDGTNIIHKAYEQNSIEFDKTLFDFFKEDIVELKNSISEYCKDYLETFNDDAIPYMPISEDNPFYTFFKDRKDSHQNISGGATDNLDRLITRSLFVLTYFKVMYLDDLQKILSIPEDEFSLLSKRHGKDMMRIITTSIPDYDMQRLALKLSEIDGITRKLVHHDHVPKILFEYSPPNVTSQKEALEGDVLENTQDRTQKTYDMLWNNYNTSDLSRSLYVKFVEQLKTIDANMEEVMKKKYIAIRVNGRHVVGIMPQKHEIVLDFKFRVSELDDTLNILRDISKIGSWTSGKSRLNVYDEDMLRYGVRMARQCYDHIMRGRNSRKSKTKKTKIKDIPRDADSLGKLKESFAGSIIDTSADNTGSKEDQSGIKAIVCEMINDYSTYRISKSLRQKLTVEFVNSRSIKKVMENNPNISKEDVKHHVRTSLRLPEALKSMENAGYLHSTPECAMQIALFAVNYYDWDGDKQDELKIVQLAQDISKFLSEDSYLQKAFSEKMRVSGKHLLLKKNSIDGRQSTQETDTIHLYTTTAVWIAVATLHQKYGITRHFSNHDILNQVIKQKLINASNATIMTNISSRCVANIKALPNNHRKLYRVSPGRYRLYRDGDYYHPSRVNGSMEPETHQIPGKYMHLLDWYRDAFCSNQENQRHIQHDPVDVRSDMRDKTDSDLIPHVGETFTWNELQKRFKVGDMGGILLAANRTIILVHEDKSFHNSWDNGSEYVTCVGEGEDDQTMIDKSNKSLMMSEKHRYLVLYFDKRRSEEFVFRGMVKYVSHAFAKQINKKGVLRRVILFNLKKL